MSVDKINFILGTPFCGSSILAKTLSTGSNVFDCGEIDRIPGVGLNEHQYDGASCLKCENEGASCPVFSDHLLEEIKKKETPYEIYAEFSRLTNASSLIDGSKHAYWFKKMISDQLVYDVARVLVLVRRPSSFIESMLNRRPDLESELWKISELWRDTYIDILRAVNTSGIPCLLMKHEMFIDNPSKTLEILSDYFGVLDVEVSKSYDFSNHHTLGGNPDLAQRIKNQNNMCLHSNDSLTDERYVDACRGTPGLFDLAINIFGYDRL